MSEKPQTVTIDGKEYRLDSLSDEARGNLMSIRFVDQEITRLEQQLSIYRTARIAYGRALGNELEKKDISKYLA